MSSSAITLKKPLLKGKTMRATIVQAIAHAMRVEMERDSSVVLLGEDIGKDEGVFRATENLFDLFGPQRVMDTPIAESGIVGCAVGMAIAGLKPVAEIQFMGFLYVATNQLLAHAARYHWRTRGRHSMSMVVRMPYGGGIHAPEHHSESYEAIYAHSPGLKVVIPSNPYDAKGLLISSIRDKDPVLFLEPKRIYRAFREEIPIEPYTVPIGKANVLREGNSLTFVSYGAMIRPTLDAADALLKEGIKAEVIDLRTISPLDEESIISSVKKTGRCVVIHEAPRFSSISSEICAIINEKALLQLLAPVVRVTGYDTPMPLAKTEDAYLPGKKRILAAAQKVLHF